MEKIDKILKSSLKRKVKLTESLLVIFLITGSIGYAIENENTNNLAPINITINNYGEQTGLELGDNSRARGVGSISTGRNGVAIGKNAVATGENETKETIERKLEENKQRLQEIADAKKVIADKAEELRLKQIRERETIEAGIRVEEIQKSKEKARLAWEDKKQELATKTEESKPFFREYQAKIDDLNSRLRGLENLEGANFASEEGLSHTADLLKTKVERDTTLNLSHDFYLDYVKNYYKALGGLRENYIISSKYDPHSFNGDSITTIKNSTPINRYRRLDFFSTYIHSGIYMYDDYMGFEENPDPNSRNNNFYKNSFKNMSNPPEKDIVSINHNADIVTKNQYDEVVSLVPKYKEAFREYFNKNNDMFLTPEVKEKFYEIFDLKADYKAKQYEIAYYQGEYEKTRNNTWLDKKKVALEELKKIEDEFKLKPKIQTLRENVYKKWKKENIDDVKEKNKLTTNRLTSELEQALGINKNAVLAKERELANLGNEVDQAKRNYEGLNPTESDMILAREYQRVKEEINRLTTDLKNAETRKDNLEKALTLHNLKNVGENQIAFGTDTLSVGNNSIAMGYKAITVGTDSVNIGARGQATGTSITQLGQDLVTNGNNNISIGNTNVINGENNIVFGRNNNVGALGDTNKSNGNIVLGSGITVSKDVANSITLGDSSTPVSNAISVGSAGNERQIKNVKNATDNQDAVTYKQLKDYVANNSSNVDTSNFANKDLSNIKAKDMFEKMFNISDEEINNINVNTSIPKTDALLERIGVKQIINRELDTKANKNLSNVTDKTTARTNLDVYSKGEVDKKELHLTPGIYAVKDGAVKLTQVDGEGTKKSEITIKGIVDAETLENKLGGKANTSDLAEYIKKDGSNITTEAERKALATNLTSGASLDTPTGTIVTDTVVKEKIDSLNTKIDEKANTSDLGNYVKLDGTNVNTDDVRKGLASKLSENSDLENPKGILVTDSKVKEYLGANYTNNTDLETKLSSKANASDLSGYVKTDGTNIDDTTKTALTNKLTNGASLDTPTGTIVTDTMVKTGLDTKLDKTGTNLSDTEKASLLQNLGLNNIPTNANLENKANKDLSNVEKSTIIDKVGNGNLDNTNGELVKDTVVKEKLDTKADKDLSNITDKETARTNLDVYSKGEVTNLITNSVPKTEGDVVSSTLEITNGTDRIIGTNDLKIELKNKSVSKEKLSDELTKNIDNKANINGNNIVNKKDKEDFRNNIDVYSKNEIDSKISNISTETNLDGEVKENEEKGVKGKVIDKHLKENYVHKSDIANRDKMIISNYTEIQENKKAIENNAREIKRVDAKINKVAALSQATASLDWGQISVGNVGVGASIAQYSNETGIAVGVAYRPTDNFFMNMKWTGLAGEPHYNSIGASATYQFNFK